MVVKRRKTCEQCSEDEERKNNEDWSRLPKDILGFISDKLPVSDRISFGNVCKSWRSILLEASCNKPSLGLPWLVMSCEHKSTTRRFFSILENKLRHMEFPQSNGGFFWGAIDDWLIMVKVLLIETWKLRISLLNPFTAIEVLLPYTSNCYHKLVVIGYPCEQNCTYMLLSWSTAEVAFLIPGAQDWCKCVLEEKQVEYIDAVSFKGCIYLLTREYNILVIDVANATSTIKREGSAAKIKTQFYEVAVNINRPRYYYSIMYLVELSGAISLVCRLVEWNQRHDNEVFKVYKLDLCRLEWVKLDNLGDQVLFVSRNCSRSFSAKDLGISIANCIYFTDGFKHRSKNEWDDVYSRLPPPTGSEIGDWGIFKLDKDSEIVTKGNRSNRWPPTWITAPQWWFLQDEREDPYSKTKLLSREDPCYKLKLLAELAHIL